MTPATRDKLLEGQSALARKVYECVPIQSPWAASEIRSQLQGNHDMAKISGCLRDLKSQGLIKEVSRLRFIRTEVKETLADKLKEATVRPMTRTQRQPYLEQEQEQHTNGMTFQLDDRPIGSPALAHESPDCLGVAKPLNEGPLARLADLSHSIREASEAHHIFLMNAAEELDQLAVELETQHEVSKDQRDKLAKLKQALAAVEDL